MWTSRNTIVTQFYRVLPIRRNYAYDEAIDSVLTSDGCYYDVCVDATTQQPYARYMGTVEGEE